MLKYLIAASFALIALNAAAQKTTLNGRVFDSTTHKGLPYATVSLVKASDSTLVSFTRADSSGNFSLPNISKGSYLLSGSFVGYQPLWQAVETGNEPVMHLGNIYMSDTKLLGDVTVTAKRAPVTINNDTLEFNAEHFQVQPNAVVEDMLKKMPGITIDKDGTVRVNGQVVRKVLVNGREFFTGDPKMATKNLPADAIDKVQVFDKKSDRAEFTGVDDGNAETAINLKLKKDRDNALFGRATAGGSNERYDAQANINQFKGDKQLSLLAMGNNTNRQGFSMSDILNFSGELSRGMRGGGGITIRMGGPGDNDLGLPVTGNGMNQQGVAQTLAGGLNYNNTWNNRSSDLNASYTASNINLETSRESVTRNLFPGNNFTRYQNTTTRKSGFQNKLSASLDQKIDTFHSFKITPAFTTQQSNNSATSFYSSLNPAKELLNKGLSKTASNADAVNLTTNILMRKRFPKKGRTLSLNANINYNHSKARESLFTENTFMNNGVAKDSLLDQRSTRDALTKNLSATFTYTEPISRTSLLEVSAIGNISSGKSDRLTYDGNGGKYDKLNSIYSNSFNSQYNYAGAGLNLRTSVQKYNYTIGATVQSADLRSNNLSYNTHVRQGFTDILPNATFQYLFSRTRNVRLQYYASTREPSVAQLQPVEDVTDPLNVIIGNPDLKRQYYHNLSLNYMSASMETGKNFFAYVNFLKTADAIVNAETIAANGSRKTTYTNVNGVYAIMGNVNYGFRVKKIKSRFDIGISSSLNHSASFLNGALNEIDNITLTPSLGYNFSVNNKMDLQLNARYSITKAAYSLQKQFNTTYYQQNYNADLSNFLPFGFVINNQLNYVVNYGRSDGFNTAIPIWNASVAKSFGKNKRAELKASGFDLLQQNTGITTYAGQNYIVDQQYNVLQRYFLLSFTYSLNKSGLNSGVRTVIRTM